MANPSFHADIIAEAAQSARTQTEIIAQAAEAAQAAKSHADVIAQAAEAAKTHAKLIALAAQSAQAAQEDAWRVAEALSMSEIRYRRLFETARDGILLLHAETGQITDANPFMAELLGYSQDEFLGKELWEIGLLADKKTSQQAFQILKRDCYVRYESLPLETRRGEKREVECVANLYRENGHMVIQCNIRDISERKIVEAKLAAAASHNERIAETLQRSLLMEPPPHKFPGLEVATLYAAALREAEVGGDFFDAFAFGGGKVALVMGDVSGKGLTAAGRTAEVKYALRAFLHAYETPELALLHLNNFICETHERDTDDAGTFIVLALVVVDTLTGDATFAAAGAEPSLVLHTDGTAERVDAAGVPLGIEPGEKYAVKAVRLLTGETVILTTDGITEARQEHAFLGADGFAELVEDIGPNVPLPALSAALYAGARGFAGGELRDDVCLLLARKHSVSS